MFLYYTLTILTLYLFLQSFFTINVSNTFENEENYDLSDIPTIPTPNIPTKNYDKVVFMVIDSLRYDFLQPHTMPNTWIHSIRGCVSKINVASPTVTMPRIKAMTSGRIPEFLDIVRNLATSETLEDSWLHSAKKAGKKIVFYGDDTWLKLFPDMFHRYEGIQSFFVTDFDSTDHNVTNNVIEELDNPDWDIMVLHYLGLDHIGHVHGALNSLISSKLTEMDHIVSMIHQKLSAKYENVLIIITSDHGMRDIGGHGGSTLPETTVPLILIGHECPKTSFSQTDLPANLAVFLELDIPLSSIGKIHKEFLKHLPFEKYLHALFINNRLLLNKKNICFDDFKMATKYHFQYLQSKNETVGHISEEYYKNCSDFIVDELVSSSAKNQNDLVLVLCIFVFLNLMVIYMELIFEKHKNLLNYRFFAVLFIVFIHLIINISIITLIFSIFLLNMFLKSCFSFCKTNKILKLSNFEKLLIFAIFLEPFTFFSSSFIEEEHQYWYFLFSTTILIFSVQILRSKRTKIAQKYLSILVFFRFLKRLNSVGDKWLNHPDISDFLLKKENYLYHQSFLIFSLILILFVEYLKKPRTIKNIFHTLVILTLVFVFKIYDRHYSVILARLIWSLIILKSKNFLIYSIVLLLKPHNIILVPFCLFSSSVMTEHLSSDIILTALHIIMSNCLFFAQGHTNSLASVDVSPGYVGLSEYQPILVFFQTILHIYAFPLLCHKLLQEKVPFKKFWLIFMAQRTSVITLTCISCYLQKNHLFIWTVFAPKLFIESVHTIFFFAEYLIYFVLHSINNTKTTNVK